ncbi:mechanosensitive ion channel family protein [Natrononativus amylolyticus]|uniref:mechanosensitive ion channel family protein n=1 Tax=Natrononativus amylolyticus TaxID=2963434 RepID=UPI0020CF9F72|nr:mechanosensitive ion channel family protein [Natrononativus amylolyticus]
MYEVLIGLDWLAERFPATNQRLAVTIAAVGVLLFALLSYRDLQRWLNERTRPLYADIVTTVGLLATALFSIAVILGVWGQTGEVQELYADQELGGETIALVIFSFVIVVSTYIVTRVVQRILHDVLSSSSAVTDHQLEISHRLSQVLIWFVALFVILGIWVDDLGGLLVGAGFLGIVLGMAANQTLGSVIAGFVLMFSRPFEIGDWIEVEDEEGIVTDISVFNTRIQSFDGEYIMIPNDVIGSSVVTNRSRRGRLRVEIDVGVDYETDLEEAGDLALECIEDLDEPMAVPSPQVVTKEFGDSAVVLGLRFWIDKPSARRETNARTAAIHAVKSAFDDGAIKIPYPQRELSGRPETEGVRIRDGSPPDRRASAADADETETEMPGATPEDE